MTSQTTAHSENELKIAMQALKGIFNCSNDINWYYPTVKSVKAVTANENNKKKQIEVIQKRIV